MLFVKQVRQYKLGGKAQTQGRVPRKIEVVQHQRANDFSEIRTSVKLEFRRANRDEELKFGRHEQENQKAKKRLYLSENEAPVLLMLNNDFIVRSTIAENLLLMLTLMMKEIEPAMKERPVLVGRFEAISSILTFHLGVDAKCVSTESNAGGTSTISEALAFQPVAKGRSCIIADQTGSGKSLAYLAPLIQRMKHDEVTGASTSLPRRPRVLILVPTGELAVQILNVCKGFSKSGCPFKSMVATGSFRWRTQVDNLDNGPDILIATPGRFLHLVNEEKLLLDNLKSAVFDEVDILFEDQDFTEVMDKLDKSPASLTIQYLHVTATLPVEIHDSLLKRYPDAMPLIGPNLHRTAAGLQEVLVDCSGDNEVSTETAFLNKKAALLQLVERRSVPKTIIFCNKIETCRRVENILNRFDRSKSKIYAYPYHAAVKQECRLKNLQDFLHSATTKPSFLVCTDRASRGLDPIDVEHVILFDFPRDPSEYVRRVGRTARAGKDGKVYVFAVGKQVGLARRIMTRNEKGHPIHSVPLDA